MNSHQLQEASDISSDNIRDSERRSGVSLSGASSAELARRFVEAALDVAKSVPHVVMPGDVANSALGLISCKLAYAAEENNWIRGWLARETESLNRQLAKIEDN